MHNKVIMFNAYLTSNFFLQKNVFYFFSPLLHNGIQISYSLSFSSLDTPIPPQCPYMSPFLSKSPTAKFNATSAGGMQLTAVDVCSPIARLLLNYYPAEGYGIKYEGSFLEKSQSGCVQNFCHFVCLHHFWASFTSD